MGYENLTDEEKALIEGKTSEEILAVAKKMGRTLSQEELDAIAGGDRWGTVVMCPKCHECWNTDSTDRAKFTCPNCGETFTS